MQKNDRKRKGKKNWRKNIDATQAVDSLHAIGTEERLHGKRIEAKTDSELFFIDSAGCEELKKKTRQLTIDKILTPNSKITLSKQTKTKRSPLSKQNYKKIKTSHEKQINKKSIELPWNNDTKPNSVQANSKILDIHPGSSYRPTSHDHLNAIRKAIAIEKRRERRKVPFQPKLIDIIIPEQIQESQDFVPLEPFPMMSDAKKKRLARKKSKQERKVEKKIKETKRKREVKKKQEAAILELEEALKESIKVPEKKKRKKIKKQKLPKNYELPMFPVATSDSISKSLRTIKTEGSLLSDRMKSIQLKKLVPIPNK